MLQRCARGTASSEQKARVFFYPELPHFVAFLDHVHDDVGNVGEELRIHRSPATGASGSPEPKWTHRRCDEETDLQGQDGGKDGLIAHVQERLDKDPARRDQQDEREVEAAPQTACEGVGAAEGAGEGKGKDEGAGEGEGKDEGEGAVSAPGECVRQRTW